MTETATARRGEILAAAARCFARRGFHQATMQDICREVGLSPGSVYRYFPGKDEIIAAIVEEDRAASVALIEAVGGGGDARGALAALADAALAGLADPLAAVLTAEITAEATRNPRVAALVRRYDDSLTAALAAALAAGQRRGEIDPALDAGRVARLLLALFDGLALRKGVAPELDLTAHGATIKALLAAMLRPGNEGAGA